MRAGVTTALIEGLRSLAATATANLAAVLAYPLDPRQRLYWLYLLTSLGFAWLAFAHARPGAAGARGLGAFLRFCFPAAVWRHPSAWLDVRYFFVHQTFRVWLYGAFTAAVTLQALGITSSVLASLFGAAPAPPRPVGAADRIAMALVTVVVSDGLAFLAHLLQHRVALLWEFHRVHHSLEVMHPLSNYREHWVDNLLYALFAGIGVGALAACAARIYGRPVAAAEALGVNALLFVFNLAGYNLRHSHVWIAWPGWLERLLGSPAYHQIHHSADPRHVDRNFAFVFPVWDWLLGSRYLPGREPEPLRLGLGDGSEGEYRSVLRLYFLPFARLWRRRRPSPTRSRPSATGSREPV